METSTIGLARTFHRFCLPVRLLATALLGVVVTASVGIGAQERSRIAYAASLSAVPIWIVQERGLLKRQGVHSELIHVGASPTALQAMLAGEVDLIATSVATLVSSRLAGADVVMIMAVTPTFPSHLMAPKVITRVAELKQKVGGVNRFGSTTDFGLRLVLRKFEVDPERDVRLVPVGGTSQMLAALSRGIIQFGLFNEPFVREAEKLGFRSILDVGSLKIPFHWHGVLTRESTVKSRRPLIAAFVRAMTEAIHIYKTEREWTKKLIGKSLRIDDPESLERTYASLNAVLPETPYPTPEGVKTLLDDMVSKDRKASVAEPREFVDLSFVQELERSGFIKILYGR